jgi:hypothetical protein
VLAKETVGRCGRRWGTRTWDAMSERSCSNSAETCEATVSRRFARALGLIGSGGGSGGAGGACGLFLDQPSGRRGREEGGGSTVWSARASSESR